MFADAIRVAQADGPHQTLIFDQPLKPFARAFGVRGHNNRTIRHFRANMIRQDTKKAYVFKLSFGREIAPDTPTRIHDIWPRMLRKR